MNRLIPPDPHLLASLRQEAHPYCVVCSPANPLGLGLEFSLQVDGSVEGVFAGGEVFEGYPGQLHGGVAAALLDGAMTHCLFAQGIQAVTAELRVRYQHPVAARARLTVRAQMVRSHAPLHLLEAELAQNGNVKVWASGKFMERAESGGLTAEPNRS